MALDFERHFFQFKLSYFKTAANTLGQIKTTQVAGLNTEIQFNNSGSFAGNSGVSSVFDSITSAGGGGGAGAGYINGLTGGSGGVHMTTAGEANINSTGRLALGGAEVAIGGNAGKSGGGRVTIKAAMDVFIKSDVITSIAAPNIVFSADSQVLIATPKVHITKDTYIDGDTHIHGDLTVNGNVHIDGTLHVVKNITTDANVIAAGGITANGTYNGAGISAASTIESRVDVIAKGVKLYSHTHGGVRSGGSSTSRPN